MHLIILREIAPEPLLAPCIVNTPSIPPHRRIGYLSAAQRVSTLPNAEASGPRAHVLGMIGGFEQHGWDVKRFIVGDRVPESWRAPGSSAKIRSSVARKIAADTARIGLGVANRYRALGEIEKGTTFVYERLAAFAALGKVFQRRGIPWVLESNALVFHEATNDRKTMALTSVARWIELGAYRECDLLICVSPELRDMILGEIALPEEKLLVVPNAVDTSRWNRDRITMRREFGERFTVGFAGILSYRQGMVAVVESLARVRTTGADVCLVVVGDGPMLAECVETAKRLEIADAIRFVGQVPWDEVPSYLMGCDVGLSPQIRLPMGKMFGSPIKLYENMAAELPVVASAFDDARAVLRDGETGFLFDPDVPETLDAALLRAYEARGRLKEMGKIARAVVEAEHSWKVRSSMVLERLGHLGLVPPL